MSQWYAAKVLTADLRALRGTRTRTMTVEAHLLRCALPKGIRRLEASQLRCTLRRELILLRIGAGLPGGNVQSAQSCRLLRGSKHSCVPTVHQCPHVQCTHTVEECMTAV